ncbi:MAG: hypothetical protein K5871_03170 [Lachnospiraceae bacterium]|nr:hypothetical protein [Lachnospiraceae bacterium]
MNLRRSDQGYFTLEASLILPFALGVILLVIQIWFFKYDRVLQDMDTDAVIIRSLEQHDMSPDEKAAYAIAQMQDRYKEAYIAWNFGDLRVNASLNSVALETTGSSFSFRGTGPLGIYGSLSCVTTRSRSSPNEVFVIRTYRKALRAEDALNEHMQEG